MSFVEILLIGIGLSMDAFSVSICKGLTTKKFSWKIALTCGIWFGFFQALMPVVGYFLGAQFQQYIDNMANAIDIDRMPPAIRAEYAKHDYHPRLSDVKRMILWNILIFPVTCLIVLTAWTMHRKNGILSDSHPSEPI